MWYETNSPQVMNDLLMKCNEKIDPEVANYADVECDNGRPNALTFSILDCCFCFHGPAVAYTFNTVIPDAIFDRTTCGWDVNLENAVFARQA